MALKDFKTLEFEDAKIDKFQTNVRDYTRQLNNDLLQGNILKNVTVGATTTNIPHMLGRPYQGWHLIDIQGDARVWRDTAGTNPDKYLPLKASTAVVVSLWVF